VNGKKNDEEKEDESKEEEKNGYSGSSESN
jgi:hypothetical protein